MPAARLGRAPRGRLLTLDDDRGRMTIVASAPVRICDNGGWTDTRFGGPGRVLNVAVVPGAEVRIRPSAGSDAVVLDVEAFGHRYPIVPGDPARFPRHPLLEAAVDAVPPPDGIGLEITVGSAMPPGSGTGTSAAVAVALLGGLAAVRSEVPTALEAAHAAHRLEVGRLGAESGIQDQLSAAFGGINYIEVDPYPAAVVRTLPTWDRLESLLTLVYLGRGHDSAGIHRQVIHRLEKDDTGGGAKALSRLRDAAAAAREAVLRRDVASFGRAMIDNTEAQRALHPGLVGDDATQVIELARKLGAVGWKVNGAGGDGGSVTILGPRTEVNDAVVRRLSGTRYQVLPIRLSGAGLQVHGTLL